jgi:hypothetical protein
MFRKHTLSLITLIVGVVFSIQAQSLVLCESYDDKGTASGVYTAWDIKAGGSYVYILYNQPYAFSEGLWYLYIDYDWNNTGTLSAYETISLTPERGKNWLVYDYQFKDIGNYRAYIMKDGVEQASVNFNIDYAEGEAALANPTADVIDTYYYEDSEITFCGSVDDSGNPVGIATEFYIGGNGKATFKAYLDNNFKPVKTTLIYVDVYKDGITEPVDAFSITVEPDWDYVHFLLELTSTGLYHVDMYTADDVFINTADVVVK